VNPEALTAIVDEDLQHIPTGSFVQDMLWCTFRGFRRHYLQEDPSKSRGDVLHESIALVRRFSPHFVAQYDKDHFGDVGE
jgi:hypothetical protein